jgi:hypothetical protein
MDTHCKRSEGVILTGQDQVAGGQPSQGGLMPSSRDTNVTTTAENKLITSSQQGRPVAVTQPRVVTKKEIECSDNGPGFVKENHFATEMGSLAASDVGSSDLLYQGRDHRDSCTVPVNEDHLAQPGLATAQGDVATPIAGLDVSTSLNYNCEETLTEF